jgi:hypothetical protein
MLFVKDVIFTNVGVQMMLNSLLSVSLPHISVALCQMLEFDLYDVKKIAASTPTDTRIIAQSLQQPLLSSNEDNNNEKEIPTTNNGGQITEDKKAEKQEADVGIDEEEEGLMEPEEQQESEQQQQKQQQSQQPQYSYPKKVCKQVIFIQISVKFP